jgi:predicted metalloendopeptidase
LAAYAAFVERALKMAGHADPAKAAAEVVAFETRVAKVSWEVAERRDIDKTYNPVTLAELNGYAPFPWSPYLAAAGMPGLTKVVLGEKTAIQAIAKIYDETPLETLKAWQTFNVVSETSPYLSKRFVDSRFEYVKALTGQSALRPRWKRGVQLVDGSLGEVVGQTYVAKYFPPSSKAQMVALIANLKTAMAARIEKAPWMSPATKTEALTKLSKMQVMVGYPDKWRDYAGLKLDVNDLYGNVAASRRFEWAYTLSDLGKPVDHGKWGMTPQTVNAYNGGLENKIVFPAGILQAPYFDPAADPAVNYGAIGAVIGHEISHGFDDQGRKIDATGKLRDWWTAEDAKTQKGRPRGAALSAFKDRRPYSPAAIWPRATASSSFIFMRTSRSEIAGPGPLQVAEHLAQHVLVAGLLEVGLDHGAGVLVDGLQAHQAGGPFAEQAVAARCDLELLLLLESELLFESLFAVVKGGHRSLGSVRGALSIAPDMKGQSEQTLIRLRDPPLRFAPGPP